jgi:hypothetical protein
VLRKAIGNQLMAHLQTTEDLEKRRAKEYGHQIVLSVDEKAGYENLTRSIMHYEGRAKEARSILRMIDDLELRVHADKCEHCNHHEIGVVDFKGKFHAVKPGQKVLVRHTDV